MNDLLSLQDLFNKKIFRIPDYQRGYSWTTLQLEEFWNDLINLVPNKDHYTGMISLKKIEASRIEKEYDKWTEEKWLLDDWGYDAYEVVDGQQRLTTMIILLNEIVQFSIENHPNREEEDRENKIFINSIPLSKIKDDYLVVKKPDSKIIKAYKFGYMVDNPSYQYFKNKILDDPTTGTIEETFYTLNLSEARAFFKKKVKELVEEKGITALEKLFKNMTQHLKFNMYYIDNDFNVYIAFETMNNRGKKLSYLELLKNRLIYLTTLFKESDDEKEKVRKEINEVWKLIYSFLGKKKEHPLNDDEFLQAHWMIYFGYSRGKSKNQTMTYDTFLLKRYFTQQNSYEEEKVQEEIEIDEDTLEQVVTREPRKKEKLTLDDIYQYIESLKILIPYWYMIHFPEETISINQKKYLDRLNRIGYVYFKPLTTVILSKEDITDEKKEECLKAIERNIFLHFRLNNYFSTYKNSFYYNLAHDLYRQEKTIDDVLLELNHIDFLDENKVARMNGLFDKFERLFKYDGFYSWNSIRHVLFEYERYLGRGTGIVKMMPEDIFKKDEKDHYSVEHIYPQTANHIYWQSRFKDFTEEQKNRLTNTLGNLLPLSQSINSSLQNYSFDEKKHRSPRGYVDGSNSEIEVSKESEWTSKEILERGIKILKFLEEEYDFVIPNDSDRVKLLGLDFLIEEKEQEDV